MSERDGLTPPTIDQALEGLLAGAKKRICCAAQEEQEAAKRMYLAHLKKAYDALGAFKQF